VVGHGGVSGHRNALLDVLTEDEGESHFLCSSGGCWRTSRKSRRKKGGRTAKGAFKVLQMKRTSPLVHHLAVDDLGQAGNSEVRVEGDVNLDG
jgi:hypothetical protein